MGNRKIWFITRPERDPKFHRDALLALRDSTNNFTVQWAGNRVAHLEFEAKLNEYEVKRENLSNDGSGGRTWAALLKTFTYVYTDADGFIKPTKSAIKILNGEKVRENIIKQILTLQIPNAYFLDTGFRPKYEDGFKIRPARFLIKLVNQTELDFRLTREEITFFALTAKKDEQLPEITRKILEFRSANDFEKTHIKEQIAVEFDHRERSDNLARDFQSAHGDVAHTFMLVCEYTDLVEYQRGSESLLLIPENMRLQVKTMIDKYDNRYPFNNRYLISLERMAENNGLDIDSYKASTFTTGGKTATNKGKTERKVKALLSDYPSLSELTSDQIRTILLKEFSSREADQLTESIHGYAYQSLNSDFVDAYLGETDNLKFEDRTGELFKAIGFNIVMRPPSVQEASTEIEILAEYNDFDFGIIDAKNYKQKFNLPANLVSHMASEYIPNYDGYNSKKLMFFGYVAAKNIGGEKNIEKISQLVKRVIPNRDIKGFMINAATLIGFLDYCLDNGIPKEERVRLFFNAIQNKAYTNVRQILKELQII